MIILTIIICYYLFSVLMGLVLIWANFELGQFLLGQFWFGSVLIEVSFDLGSILIWVSFDWFSFDLVHFRFRPALIGVSFDLWSIFIRASFDLGQFCRQIGSIYTFLKMKEQSCKKHSLTNWIEIRLYVSQENRILSISVHNLIHSSSSVNHSSYHLSFCSTSCRA